MHSPEIGQEGGGNTVAVDVESLTQSFSTYLRGLCKSEGTIKQYLSDIRGWWVWWGKPIEEFDIEAWDAWTSWQAEQGEKHKCK